MDTQDLPALQSSASGAENIILPSLCLSVWTIKAGQRDLKNKEALAMADPCPKPIQDLVTMSPEVFSQLIEKSCLEGFMGYVWLLGKWDVNLYVFKVSEVRSSLAPNGGIIGIPMRFHLRLFFLSNYGILCCNQVGRMGGLVGAAWSNVRAFRSNEHDIKEV